MSIVAVGGFDPEFLEHGGFRQWGWSGDTSTHKSHATYQKCLSGLWKACVKGTVHQKWSSFIHHLVFPNLYNFCSSSKHKGRYFSWNLRDFCCKTVNRSSLVLALHGRTNLAGSHMSNKHIWAVVYHIWCALCICVDQCLHGNKNLN